MTNVEPIEILLPFTQDERIGLVVKVGAIVTIEASEAEGQGSLRFRVTSVEDTPRGTLVRGVETDERSPLESR